MPAVEVQKIFTVAVGQEVLETPEGLYEIQAKEENPIWARAGIRLGGGPRRADDPARTVEPDQGALDGDLRRHRDPRHRCDRLARQRRLTRVRADGDPDVEELYDEVAVGTPIVIG